MSEAAEALDARISALSDQELDVFLKEIMAEPEMMETAIAIALHCLTRFLETKELTEEFMDSLAPNEMIAVIVTVARTNPEVLA